MLCQSLCSPRALSLCSPRVASGPSQFRVESLGIFSLSFGHSLSPTILLSVLSRALSPLLTTCQSSIAAFVLLRQKAACQMDSIRQFPGIMSIQRSRFRRACTCELFISNCSSAMSCVARVKKRHLIITRPEIAQSLIRENESPFHPVLAVLRRCCRLVLPRTNRKTHWQEAL